MCRHPLLLPLETVPSRPSIALVAALAVFAVSAQCVFRCAAADCRSSSASVPPCHRHRAPAPAPLSGQPCSQWLLLDARSAPQHLLSNSLPVIAPAPLAEAPAIAYASPAVAPLLDPSPPGRLSVSLRI